MRFEVKSRSASRPGNDGSAATTRVLVVADLAGAAAPDAPPLDERRVATLDIEAFDEALTEIAPAVSSAGSDLEEPLTFTSLDDFHPDRLVERVPAFDRLRSLRARLQDPATYPSAAAELTGRSSVGRTEAATGAPADRDTTFERLLGTSGPAPVASASAAAGPPGLDAFIRSLVAQHVVAATDPQQRQLVSAVDTALSDLMRAVLHDPAIQRLEATWRGVRWLLSRAEGTDDHAVDLAILHATREELADPAGIDGTIRRLARHGTAWSLVVADVSVGPSADGLTQGRGLARLATSLGCPVLAAGSDSLASGQQAPADPASWTALPEATEREWADLRALPGAGLVGLTWPRFLLRLPYGPDTDPIESFAFEEMSVPRQGDYLWGNGAFAAALSLVRQMVDEGGAEQGDIDDLPAFAYVDRGETVLRAGGEYVVTERAIDAILARGVMPIVSYRHRNAIRLVRLQSIAGTALAGPAGTG